MVFGVASSLFTYDFPATEILGYTDAESWRISPPVGSLENTNRRPSTAFTVAHSSQFANTSRGSMSPNCLSGLPVCSSAGFLTNCSKSLRASFMLLNCRTWYLTAGLAISGSDFSTRRRREGNAPRFFHLFPALGLFIIAPMTSGDSETIAMRMIGGQRCADDH